MRKRSVEERICRGQMRSWAVPECSRGSQSTRQGECHADIDPPT
jgi:hypothetical protein